jgi:phosphoribosyl 1,2-cyclic phosphate phosphodiesterase
MDDLRIFTQRFQCELPIYGSAESLAEIRVRYWYVFEPTQEGGGKPKFSLQPLSGPFDLFGRTVVPIPVWHGELPVLGFRFGDFAYVTDVSRIPPESLDLLYGLDTLILGALRHRPHATHFNVAQALEIVAQLRPRRTYFTHICHDLEHEATNAELPDGVELAYDGLRLEFPEESA